MYEFRLSVYSLCLCVFVAIISCGPPPPPLQPELTHFATPGKGLPFFSGENFDPVWPDRSKKQKKGSRALRYADYSGQALRGLSNFELTDQAGKTRTSKDLNGRVVVLAYFFTRCHGICPLVTANLRHVAGQFRQDRRVDMVSMSINPRNDTPAAMRAFISKYNIKKKNWYFLTGEKREIYRIAREDFDADLDIKAKEGKSDFLHTENVYLLDRNLFLRGIYKGRGIAQMRKLVTHIGQLLAE